MRPCRRFDQISDHKNDIYLYGKLCTNLLAQAVNKSTKVMFTKTRRLLFSEIWFQKWRKNFIKQWTNIAKSNSPETRYGQLLLVIKLLYYFLNEKNNKEWLLLRRFIYLFRSLVRSIKSNMSRIWEQIHKKMKLGTCFYNNLVSKISKIRIVWPWGIFFIWINYRPDIFHGIFQFLK